MSRPSSERRLVVNGIPLVARIPDGWRHGTAVILAHGAGQGMDSPFMTFFYEGLSELGYLAVKFNFSYMEAGRRAPDSRRKLGETYQGIVEAVVKEFAPGLLVIGGKSMGGRIASYVAAGMPGVDGLLFLGYPLHPAGQPDRMRDSHLYELDMPMLFVSGTRDTLAQKELLNSVIRRIGTRASVHWIERGDHSFRSGADSAAKRADALTAIDEWLRTLSRSRTASV